MSEAYGFFGLRFGATGSLDGGFDEGLEGVKFERAVLVEQVVDGFVGCGDVLGHVEVLGDDGVDDLEDGVFLFVHEEVVQQPQRGFLRGVFRRGDGLFYERADHLAGLVAARPAV